MRLRPLPRALGALALAGLGLSSGLAVGACGGGTPELVVHSVKPLAVDSLPAEVVGLTVKAESSDQFKEAKRPYIDGVALYSLRKGEELEATLQISRFDESARLSDPAFRGSLIAQIGSTAPKEVRMGDDTVYLTSGSRQSVSVWFRGRYMFILSSREEFGQPRALMRALLKVQP